MKHKILHAAAIFGAMLTLAGTMSAEAAVINLKVGETRVVTTSDAMPTYTPYNGLVNRVYVWSSNNTGVATVDSTGTLLSVVRAVGAGTAIVGNKQTLTYEYKVSTGNKMSGYESISGDTYTVIVTDPDLKLKSVSPKDGSSDIEVSSQIEFQYNDKLSKGAAFENIALRDDTTGGKIAATAEISDDKVLIKPNDDLIPGHTFTATVPADAVINTSGNTLSTSQTTTFRTRIIDFDSITPAAGSINIPVNTQIVLSYKSDVRKGSRADAITITDNKGGTIPFKGSVSNQSFIITPLRNYSYNTEYTVTIPAGAVANAYGIDEETQHSTSFTTKPGSPVPVNTQPLSKQSGVPLSDDIKLTYDYAITAAAAFADITLINTDTGKAVAGKAKADGLELTFTPEEELDYDSGYEFTVPAGALTNAAGERTKQYKLRFRTVSMENEIITMPEFKQVGGVISLTAMRGASIFYTTDGTSPISNGTKYAEPIHLDSNHIIRAVAVKNGSISEEATYEYKQYCLTKKLSFGGGGIDEFYDIQQTFDGGYIVVGYSQEASFGNGDWAGVAGKGGTDAIIIKFDKDYNIEWKKSFGGSGTDDFSTVTQTVDGGYIASGYASSESFGNGDWTGYSGSYSYKMPFVKFDAEGNVVWKKTLGSNGSASCRKVKALSDGGIAAVGQVGWIKTAKSNYSSLTEYGRMDAVIIKLSSTGDVIWMQSYGSTGDDSFYDVIEDSDGGLITVGNNKITGAAVKYDKNGNFVWQLLDANGYSNYSDIAAASDGGLYIYENYANGTVPSKGGQRLLKYDADKNMIWDEIGFSSGRGTYDIAGIFRDTEDGLVCAGHITETVTGGDAFEKLKLKGGMDAAVSRYDPSGELVYIDAFGGSDEDKFTSIVMDGERSVLVGRSAEGSFGNGDWSDTVGKGGADAFLVEYYYSDQPPKTAQHSHGAAKNGTISVSGEDEVSKGETFMCPIYFKSDKETAAANIVIKYPSAITYAGYSGDYKIYETSGVDGEDKTLTISCDFDNKVLAANKDCVIAYLQFTADAVTPADEYKVSVSVDDSFIMDSLYNRINFSASEDYNFKAVQAIPKDMFVTGKKNIRGVSEYSVQFFPPGASDGSVAWSVDDSSSASIDENGILTPQKNGKITARAYNEESGLSAELEIEASGIATYIDSLSSDTGYFTGGGSEKNLRRTLYVPDGTASVMLTAAYTRGSLISESGIMFNGIAKQFSIAELPQEITLTKKADGCDDAVYVITVRSENERDEHIVENITEDFDNDKVTVDILWGAIARKGYIAAVAYDEDGRILSAESKDIAGIDGDSAEFDLNISGAHSISVYIWDEMKPLAKKFAKML